MSMEALRVLRRAGKRPGAPILVIVGNKPRNFEDKAGEVWIRPTDKPEVMDFRPFVGLWVAVLVAEKAEAIGGRVLDAVMNAGAKVYAVVLPDRTVHMGIVGPTNSHIRNMVQTWDAYQ